MSQDPPTRLQSDRYMPYSASPPTHGAGGGPSSTKQNSFRIIRRTYTRADGQILGESTLYHPFTVEQSHLLSAHEASLSTSEKTLTIATDSAGPAEADAVDFLKPTYLKEIKAYLDTHGELPSPFVADRASATATSHIQYVARPTSFAVIYPSTEVLRRLLKMDVAIPTEERESDWLQCRSYKGFPLPAAHPINTNMRFTCQGVSVSHTTKGWMIYEGEMEAGMRVDPTLTIDLQVKYGGSRLGGLKAYLKEKGIAVTGLKLSMKPHAGQGDARPSPYSMSPLPMSAEILKRKGVLHPRNCPAMDLSAYVDSKRFLGTPQYSVFTQHAADASSTRLPGLLLLGDSGGPPLSSVVMLSDHNRRGQPLKLVTDYAECRVTTSDEPGPGRNFPRNSGGSSSPLYFQLCAIVPACVTGMDYD